MSQRDNANSFDLARLRTGAKPFRVHFFPRLRSTNDHAASLRRRGDLFAPAIVLTPHQIAGRGRGANKWWSTRGCLTVTFVLPAGAHREAHHIPLIAGLAVRDAVAELTGIDAILLKWPNDLMYGGRKLGGLLCERVERADLIGLGLNVNVNPRRAPGGLTITSLSQIAGRAFDITDALTGISARVHAVLSRRGERFFAETLQRYDAYHALPGLRVTIVNGNDHPLTGTVEGLDSTGRLILRDRSRHLHRIIAGQVQLH